MTRTDLDWESSRTTRRGTTVRPRPKRGKDQRHLDRPPRTYTRSGRKTKQGFFDYLVETGSLVKESPVPGTSYPLTLPGSSPDLCESRKLDVEGPGYTGKNFWALGEQGEEFGDMEKSLGC